jgi:VanZ family protein
MKLRYWLLTLLYCGAIFYLSSRERLPHVDLGVDFGDKLMHAGAFGIMAGIVSVGIRRSNDYVAPWVQYLAPTAFAILYGAADEFHQSFVPNRNADALDLLADAAGAVAVQFFLCRLLWRIPFRQVCTGCNPAPSDGIQ